MADRAAKFKSPNKGVSSPQPASTEKKGPTAADKFRAAGAGAGLGDRCKSCDKMVYTAEKIIAQGFSWHKLCFTCGHKTGKGCNKSLGAGGYEEHSGVAYCKNCARKLFQGQVSTLAVKGGWMGPKPISHGALTGVMSPIPDRGRAPSIHHVGGTPAAVDMSAAAADASADASAEAAADASASASASAEAAPTPAPQGESAAAPPAAPDATEAPATTVESEAEPLEGDAAAATAAEGQEGYYAEGQEGYYAEGQEGYYAEGQEGYYAEGQEGYYAEGQEGYYAEEGAAAADAGAVAADAGATEGEGTYEQYADEHHYGEGEEAAAAAAAAPTERTVAYYECPYTAPFDKKGAVYWVGTSGHQIEFENPQVTGLVYVEISTLYRGQLVNITSFQEQTTAAERIAFATYTNNQPRSWLLVDFGPERRLRPSYYCLKHGASGVGNSVRNWVLEGKADESRTCGIH